MAAPGFFDNYPHFLATTETRPSANRLNQRHRVLIEANRPLIDRKRVLDIACHDGRWSFSALQAGAAFVLGVEARERLVEKARANLRHHGVDEDKYAIVCDEALGFLQAESNLAADTVFCFGFLYHTAENFRLLELVEKSARPAHIIIDTNIIVDPRPVILLHQEDCADPRNAVKRAEGKDTVLVGVPSLSAVTTMLDAIGFEACLWDWHDGAVDDWADLEDYRDGTRITVVASRKGQA